ncbi:MAG TPA: hypothetical protein VF737_04770 [Gemmatimonadaceae bacterium]
MRSCSRRFSRLAGVLALGLLSGCVPRLAPLRGVPAPARFPATAVGDHHRRIVFRWELDGPDLVARGEGAVRFAPPDSARFDFFLAGGEGGGAAALVGNELRLPRGDAAADFVPPPPLLWAALGRLALPEVPDTVARQEGTMLRADIGRPVQWRVTFDGDSLRRLERVRGGRVLEWVTRTPDGHIRYHHASDRRTLDLVITTSADSGPFDDSLWTFP